MVFFRGGGRSKPGEKYSCLPLRGEKEIFSCLRGGRGGGIVSEGEGERRCLLTIPKKAHFLLGGRKSSCGRKRLTCS